MKPLAISILILALAGCAAQQDRTPPNDVDVAALVTERFGDCLTALNATPPVANDGGTMVTATSEGVILQWNVVFGSTGDVLTWPDAATTAALETVGC